MSNGEIDIHIILHIITIKLYLNNCGTLKHIWTVWMYFILCKILISMLHTCCALSFCHPNNADGDDDDDIENGNNVNDVNNNNNNYYYYV